MGVLMNLTPTNGDGVNTVFMLGNNADLDSVNAPALLKNGTALTLGVDYLNPATRTNIKPWSEGTKAQQSFASAGVTDDSLGMVWNPVYFPNALHFANAAQLDQINLPASLNGTVNPIISAYVQMDDLGAINIAVDLVSGDFALLANAGGAFFNANITTRSLGAGLYRISAKWVGTLTDVIWIYRAATQSGRGFKISGIQVEAGGTATWPTPYIATGAAAVTVPSTTLFQFVTVPSVGELITYNDLNGVSRVLWTGDGVTQCFTLPFTPARIYQAGTLKTAGTDYTISSYTCTFVAAPAAGDLVQGDYITFDRN
jgi:hypothetical protein